MKQKLRLRFWLELLVAAVNVGLLVLTALWPQWIELVFRIDPDAGSGEFEWLIAAVTLAISIMCFVLARMEWRRNLPKPI